MEIERCQRCGSTDVHKGTLSKNITTQYPIIWISQSEEMVGDVVVNGFLCESSGHIELTADSDIISPKVRQNCPFCKAIYSHSKKRITNGEIVCQNCEKRFPINHSGKTKDIIDEIEEDLREE